MTNLKSSTVLFTALIAVIAICMCCGAMANTGGEELSKPIMPPTVNMDGLKVQTHVLTAEVEAVDDAKTVEIIEPEQVTVKLKNTAISTVAMVEAAQAVEASQVNGTYCEAIPLSADLQAVLFEACAENGVDPALALALIETESQFNPYALNRSSGCYGLCQLNPAYFPSGLSPADNIRHGMRYLGRQLRVYGSEASGLTAYNAGHDNGSRSYANTVMARAEKWQSALAM